MCVSPYVAACIRARRCVRVWLRYVILCGPQLLCHTAVHDGGERSRLPPPPNLPTSHPLHFWFLLSCFGTFSFL